MFLQELNQGLNQDLPSLWKPNYTHTCAPKETKKVCACGKNVNNVSDLQFTLGNVFFFLKTHTLHKKGGEKIPLFMFWHSKYNHTLQLSQHKILGGK